MNLPIHMLTRLAWRNIWRNHRRTLVMLAAIAVGVWSMVWLTAIMRGMVDQMIKDSIENFTGHIQIHATAYRDDPSINNSMPAIPDSLITALNDSEIITSTSRIKVPGVISSERESFGVTLVGINPETEQGLLFLHDSITEGRNLQSSDDKGVIIGRKLAERLETKLGRRIVLMSQDPENNIVDRGFRIVGIFKADMEATETNFVFLGINTAQKVLKMGDNISEIAVLTGDYRNLAQLVATISSAAVGLEVLAWNEIDAYLGSMLTMVDGFILVWFVVVFLAMSFGLINTLLMAVFERTREIGLVQALGMRPSYILLQVLIESFFLLILGLALGNLLAWLTILPIQDGWDISGLGNEGLQYSGISAILYPVVLAKDVIISNAVVVVLGLFASMYPAWRAARYVPVEAITRT